MNSLKELIPGTILKGSVNQINKQGKNIGVTLIKQARFLDFISKDAFAIDGANPNPFDLLKVENTETNLLEFWRIGLDDIEIMN